jgi:hypothetical protein
MLARVTLNTPLCLMERRQTAACGGCSRRRTQIAAISGATHVRVCSVCSASRLAALVAGSSRAARVLHLGFDVGVVLPA